MNRGILVSATAFLAAVCFMLPATGQINEGFDHFQIGARPPGWQFIYCDRNSDADMQFYGDAAPGIQLGGWPTMKARIVTEEYELVGPPEESNLSFFVQAIASNPSSALNIREYDGDAAAWFTLTYLEGPFALGGETITLALNASSSQRVWLEYIKLGDINDPIVVIDDVAITNVTTEPAPVPPDPDPTPIYLVVAADDYTGDSVSDIALYDRTSGEWRILDHGTFTFGGGDFDIPAPGDYNGDGRADLAYFDRTTGRWYAQSAPGEWIIDGEAWGIAGDIPVPGDYSGDGTTDPAVWRPSTGWWYVRNVTAVRWGYEGVIPAPGDYTGDGTTDIAYIDPIGFSTWRWFVLGVPGSRAWGHLTGYAPVPGDYTGDGTTELGAYHFDSNRWYWITRDGTFRDSALWGLPGAVPVVGDFDGSGAVDPTVFLAPDRWEIRPDVTKIFEADLEDDVIVTGAPGY